MSNIYDCLIGFHSGLSKSFLALSVCLGILFSLGIYHVLVFRRVPDDSFILLLALLIIINSVCLIGFLVDSITNIISKRRDDA